MSDSLLPAPNNQIAIGANSDLAAESTNRRDWIYLTFLFAFCLFLRLLPLVRYSLPLGYDPGLYKFVSENPFSEIWTYRVYPLPFTLAIYSLRSLLGSFAPIPYILAAFSASTVFVFYVTGKKLYSRGAALVAATLFALSVTQVQVSFFGYYKNSIGILLLLLAWPELERAGQPNVKLIILGGLIGGFHRPALLVLILAILINSFRRDWLERNTRSLSGLANVFAIGILVLAVNFDRVDEYLIHGSLNFVNSIVLDTGRTSGAFYGGTIYFLSALPYIPFCLIGIWRFRRSQIKTIGIAVALALLIAFRLYFHNRMLIYLDLLVIFFAAQEINYFWRNNTSRFSRGLLAAVLAIGFSFLAWVGFSAKPLISLEEFAEIQQLDDYLSGDETLIVTDTQYASWIKGWVGARVVGPGLFDLSGPSRGEWFSFWRDGNLQSVLDYYETPIYLHVGRGQLDYMVGKPGFELVTFGDTRLYIWHGDS